MAPNMHWTKLAKLAIPVSRLGPGCRPRNQSFWGLRRLGGLKYMGARWCDYPDHCVGSIVKKKVIWIATGKNGEVRTKNLREQPRNTCYYPMDGAARPAAVWGGGASSGRPPRKVRTSEKKTLNAPRKPPSTSVSDTKCTIGSIPPSPL